MPLTQVSALLKYQDAVTIASKLNAAEGEDWTYVPRDAGNGRGVIVVLNERGRELGFL